MSGMSRERYVLAGQLVPGQSTAALVIHHPEAIYFGAV